MQGRSCAVGKKRRFFFHLIIEVNMNAEKGITIKINVLQERKKHNVKNEIDKD